MRVATAQDVAEMLQVSTDTVYRLAARGELPSFRIGVALRFDLDRLEALWAAQERQGAAG